jgi:AcrR family transcriptional regulator
MGGTQVSEVQRTRLIAAAVEVVGEHGYSGMTVARVTSRAGVSRRTFYDLFSDREDCFGTVFEEAVEHASLVARDAASRGDSWQERLRCGLTGLLGLFTDEPMLGSLVVVDALAAGPKVLERRARALARLSEVVDEGRSQIGPGHGPAPLTAEGVVGAVLAVVHARLLESDRRALVELLNPLMSMIVLPYLGQAAAARELRRATPTLRRVSRPSQGDLLDGLQMRLTYRTLRVLTAIATHPGSSNRAVAHSAGVHDQGQISKLLTRLEHLGLIHNTGQGPAKGEPNAWALTARGQEVERVVTQEADRADAAVVGVPSLDE